MSLESVPAVLLRTHAFGDTSLILRFLTPRHGVLSVMARGVRSPARRTSSPPQPFSTGILQVDVRPGRELQGFRGFDVTHPRRGLGSGLARFGAASFLAELVLRHGGGEGVPDLFDALLEALDRVDAGDDRECVALAVAGGWRLTALLGYAPELDRCVLCGVRLEEGATGRFHHPGGGVAGPECAGEGPGWGPRIGPGTRAELARMLEGKLARELPRGAAHLKLLHDFLTWHLGGGRPLESFAFLRRQAVAWEGGGAGPGG